MRDNVEACGHSVYAFHDAETNLRPHRRGCLIPLPRVWNGMFRRDGKRDIPPAGNRTNDGQNRHSSRFVLFGVVARSRLCSFRDSFLV